MSLPRLFSPDYAEPIDPRSQVDRLPGTDAPCMCDDTGDPWWACAWPFCQPSETEGGGLDHFCTTRPT